MFPASLMFRIAKLVCVAAIALMAVLIVIGNTTDYWTNYLFVEHVMKMDTTFPGSRTHYRSINSPLLFHAGYILIILLEFLMAFCCVKGSWKLFQNLRTDAATFYESKNWAVAGITVGIIIWFLGFEVIGGEWFAMWQSTTWNSLSAAERITDFLVLTLILLHLKETVATGNGNDQASGFRDHTSDI